MPICLLVKLVLHWPS